MLCIDYRTRRRTGRSERKRAIGNGYASGSENRKVGFLGLGFSIESMFVGAAGNGRKSLRSSLELLY